MCAGSAFHVGARRVHGHSLQQLRSAWVHQGTLGQVLSSKSHPSVLALLLPVWLLHVMHVTAESDACNVAADLWQLLRTVTAAAAAVCAHISCARISSWILCRMEHRPGWPVSYIVAPTCAFICCSCNCGICISFSVLGDICLP